MSRPNSRSRATAAPGTAVTTMQSAATASAALPGRLLHVFTAGLLFPFSMPFEPQTGHAEMPLELAQLVDIDGSDDVDHGQLLRLGSDDGQPHDVVVALS